MTPALVIPFEPLFQILCIYFLVIMFGKFRCLRERVVLSIWLLTMIRAVGFAVMSSLRPLALAHHICEVNLVLWISATIVSLSMLVSSTRYKEGAL